MQRLVRKLFLLHAVGDLTWVALLFSMIMIYREEPQVIPGSYLPALVVYVLLVCCFLLTGLRIPVQVSRFVLFDHILLIGQIISYIGLVLLIHHPLVFIVSMLFTPILSQWCLRNACAMIIGSGALVTMIAWLLWPLNWHAVFGLAVISPQLFLMYFVRILLHEGNVQQELEEKNLELQATQDL
ncbi:MAG: hypothetical protein GY806_19620, partial [Gammaproteobacteria bacterium]|nr:hypothetical protein [Gammaproteobacteria bacterium]